MLPRTQRASDPAHPARSRLLPYATNPLTFACVRRVQVSEHGPSHELCAAYRQHKQDGLPLRQERCPRPPSSPLATPRPPVALRLTLWCVLPRISYNSYNLCERTHFCLFFMKGSAIVRQHFSYRCAQDTPSAQPNHLLHATSDTLLRLEQMTVASRTRARHSVAFWVFPDYWSATVWR